MWTIRIRWKAILEPWCWIVDHAVIVIHAGTAYDLGGYGCLRCEKRWTERFEWREPDGSVRVIDGVAQPKHILKRPKPGLRSRALVMLDRAREVVKTAAR